jgi:STE24 endopeptidase
MRFARVLAPVLFGFWLASGAAALQAQAAPEPSPQEKQMITAQQPPASEQAYNLPPDKLAKANALDKIRITLDIVGSLWGIAFLWLLLSRRWAAGLQGWASRITARRWAQGLLFFAAFIVITTIASLPLDAIGHAVSYQYGISVQHWGGWFDDQAKGLGVSLVLATLVMLLFNWLVRVSPRVYWFWVWLVSLPLILLSVFASPLIIDPLFNHFEPLTKTHAALVGKLEQVVARTGTNIPPERMFLMKASEKSNGLNAYVTGIGASKRFVMWDTATDRLPDDEVMYVFGHESGHYVLGHIPKMLSIFAVGLFFVFWACARLSEAMLRCNGARWGIEGSPGVAPVATRAGFVALFLVLNVVGFLVTPAVNTLSRHFEHQADVYGQEAIHGLVADPQRTAVSGFNHLGEAWLENPNPNPFIEFWLYNHPSVKSRANFAAHYDPWANGGHGEFFRK